MNNIVIKNKNVEIQKNILYGKIDKIKKKYFLNQQINCILLNIIILKRI
jgi:hypothetical protein